MDNVSLHSKSEAIIIEGIFQSKILDVNIFSVVLLKVHCHPQISYSHTKLISQVSPKNIYLNFEVSFQLIGF